MTATFLLVRHAAHVHLDRRLSGRMPGVPLSEAGRAQAAALATKLMGDAVAAVEHSPLERTRDTAAAIAAATGAAAMPAAALVEIDMGDWTGRAFADFGDDPAWREWNEQRGTARVPGGETMAEAQARIVGHLAARARERPGETLAIVTHSDMIKAAIAHVIGLPLDRVLALEIGPASVSRVVLGDWGGKLLTMNER